MDNKNAIVCLAGVRKGGLLLSDCSKPGGNGIVETFMMSVVLN